MVTTPELPESPTTTKQDIIDAAYAASEAASKATRATLTGSVTGNPRRNLLYVIAVLLIVVGLPLLALLPLLLLALTDAVVE